MRTVRAVVLAAGLSRRFGGPNKLLQPWGECTVVGTVAQTLLACGLPVTVVTGRDAPLVAEAVQPAETAFNPDFAEGMGGSLAVGVRSLPECDGVLIALGDMPGLRQEVVLTMLDEFQHSDPEAILKAAYEDAPNEPGHPTLFASCYVPELAQLTGDAGGISVVKRHSVHVQTLRFAGRLDDIDTPD